MKVTQKIVLAAPARTPFAQIGKALAQYPGHHLGKLVGDEVMKRSGLKPTDIDGVIVGEGFANAPNSARVIANLMNLPLEIPCLTVANNCVSGLEAVAEASRRIMLGEGEVFLVIGEESQTSMPFVVKNARLNKKTNSLDSLVKLLPNDLPEGVELRDTLEDGLGDGETSYGMQVTAEILAQNYALPRETQDKVAYESFKRAFEATQEGRYKPYIMEVKDDEGNMLQADEAVLLREGLVKNPTRMGRAMLMFDNPAMKFDAWKEKYGKDLKKSHGPTVSIFNASPRSDGAAGIIVASEAAAKRLGLKAEAVVTGFKMKGVDPNLMGLGQAEATLGLLEEVGEKVENIDVIEIHEAFAATAVAALEEIKIRTGFDWEKNFDAKKINPNGGSIAIGHPFGATGVRLLHNAIMDFHENKDAKKVLVTACAHGGIAGSMIVERP
ncbi:acetyl-CoA C-acyltransferase [Leptospira biflexa]|jgi:acetyl-CoA C-acetyltransferase|uniref:Putative acetyl-CoA acetyltransferase (Acetoacetyl-CoA thiolase) putative signal peptide n=1 Tax=Leptospira biflexa serovar Patoc (strain Patoc 1 / ATCC 23582 / Paris) TaxID=456481 RepID=B0SL32_LEPBP|nr:thiolase family protein [Leptospira biflexa]ABZ93216.1 Acetyl-CoA acetyltransferase [Leptospira biflexa serovar Patoc strain 'Patoc 1 (Ames)']ABZ96839.1 Putative acetyl-CoA acetyltransferase (Acetoacetyl-CoA thiolase); putative signal peptide [Leptospira biflexa serovar Patoc strain 'Patoc 1 (Paris)']TGM38113.1 acetyl-CoA C-acyltransferase [Leptospira biflexa]TGM41444.1 acetyl-CoA C-acyltransferase [Leptospira biflexa]TGM47648.1 acetyl-CoA C-acyltransferase [Leptospira biflexa]